MPSSRTYRFIPYSPAQTQLQQRRGETGHTRNARTNLHSESTRDGRQAPQNGSSFSPTHISLEQQGKTTGPTGDGQPFLGPKPTREDRRGTLQAEGQRQFRPSVIGSQSEESWATRETARRRLEDQRRLELERVRGSRRAASTARDEAVRWRGRTAASADGDHLAAARRTEAAANGGRQAVGRRTAPARIYACGAGGRGTQAPSASNKPSAAA